MLEHKPISDALWLGVNSITSKILWAFTLILLMHELGPEGFAYITVGWAYFGLLAAVTDFGSAQSYLRKSSRDINYLKSYFLKVLMIKTFSTMSIIVSSIVLIYLMSNNLLTYRSKVLLLAGAAIMIDHFYVVFSYTAQLIGKLRIFTIIRVTQSVAILSVFYFILNFGGKELEVSIAHLMLTLLFLLIGMYYFLKFEEIKSLKKSNINTKDIIKEGMPFLSSSILNLAYYRVDVILLSYFATQTLTGIYSGQYQIILTFYAIPAILISAILPSMYKLNNDSEGIKNNLIVVSKYLNAIGIFLFPIVYLYSMEIMEIVGGEEFSVEHQGLKILSLLLLMFMFTVVLNALVAVDKIKDRIICETTALLVILIFGPFAIINYDLIGMAMIAIISYLLSGVLGIRFLVSAGYMDLFKILKDILKLIASIIPSISILLFLDISIIVKLTLYIVLFLICLKIFKVWDYEDMSRFKYVASKLYRYSS